MRVEISPDALADLEDITRWIGQDNPERARSFAVELQRKCATLAHDPKRFSIVRAVNGSDIRKRSHGRYLIFYYILVTHIEIVRIVHGARDWAAMFAESE